MAFSSWHKGPAHRIATKLQSSTKDGQLTPRLCPYVQDHVTQQDSRKESNGVSKWSGVLQHARRLVIKTPIQNLSSYAYRLPQRSQHPLPHGFGYLPILAILFTRYTFSASDPTKPSLKVSASCLPLATLALLNKTGSKIQCLPHNFYLFEAQTPP